MWMIFTFPETRMIVLTDAENRTIVSSFICRSGTKHRNVTIVHEVRKRVIKLLTSAKSSLGLKCQNCLKLQDVTKTRKNSRFSPLQLHLNRRRAAANAGYSYSRMMAVTGSSSTATGTATARASATRQGTTGSAMSTFIR